MIFGDCPHCGEHFAINVPDKVALPVMIKYTCEHCHEWFWEHISRWDPKCYLPEEVTVNERTKKVTIIKKKGNKYGI